MRLSFYSGLALAMIAADNAKAQEQQKEPKRAGSFLAQACLSSETAILESSAMVKAARAAALVPPAPSGE